MCVYYIILFHACLKIYIPTLPPPPHPKSFSRCFCLLFPSFYPPQSIHSSIHPSILYTLQHNNNTGSRRSTQPRFDPTRRISSSFAGFTNTFGSTSTQYQCYHHRWRRRRRRRERCCQQKTALFSLSRTDCGSRRY